MDLEATASTIIKLASIARHAEEFIGPNGNMVDADVIRNSLKDPEVAEIMKRLDALALLPVMR